MKAAHLLLVRCACLFALVLVVVASILGCGGGVEVIPLKSTLFLQMLDADAVGDVRRSAHWMGPYLRGESPSKAGVLDPEKLPEAYTPHGEPGKWASEYHLGYAALALIRENYAAGHSVQLDKDELIEVVDEAGGNTYAVNDFDEDRRLDIADIKSRQLFEVVPPGETHRFVGVLRRYRIMNSRQGIEDIGIDAQALQNFLDLEDKVGRRSSSDQPI